MARSFTRGQLYELVWSRPMTHLAKEFGISDVALHKICRKHDIPNPPLGWWAKKAAGKRVTQTPLPEAEAGAFDKITIADGDFSRESSILADIREQARIRASEGETDQSARSFPIIDRTLDNLRNAKPSDIGLVAAGGVGLIKCEIGPPSIGRLSSILLQITYAASLQGFELVPGDECAQFKSESETIGFSITEAVRREAHVLTDAEHAKEEAWQRKRDRAARLNSWDNLFLEKPKFPELDFHLTGQLSFEFEEVYLIERGTTPRRRFRDTKLQRLESMVSNIAVGLAVLAAAKTELRLKREAEQRQREELQRQRELVARAKYAEDRRSAGLEAVLSELAELDRLRRLIATLKVEIPATPTPRLSAFLAWATDHLAEREARLASQALEDRFTAENLFGGDDDRGYVSPSWY